MNKKERDFNLQMMVEELKAINPDNNDFIDSRVLNFLMGYCSTNSEFIKGFELAIEYIGGRTERIG